MRTWLLAPDGVWAEVTERVTEPDPSPDRWGWQTVVDGIGGAGGRIDDALVIDRSSLTLAHSTIADRWIANRIWDAVCCQRVSHVSALRVTPNHSGAQDWIEALSAYTNRPAGEPNYAWRERRNRWLLWAHSDTDAEPELAGAHIVIDASRRS